MESKTSIKNSDFNMKRTMDTKAGSDSVNPEEKKNLKIFLSCLPKAITEEDIRSTFSKFGPIRNFEFEITIQNGGKSKLINASLTCASTEMKKIILGKVHKVRTHTLKVSDYLEKSQLDELLSSLRKRKVYLKKLKDNFTNDSLRALFSQFGIIEKAYCTDGTRKRKGFKYGYIIFKEENSMKNLPFEGVEYEGELIKWTSHGKKMLMKKESREKGNGEFPHHLKPCRNEYFKVIRNKRRDEENLLLTINTKNGYYSYLRMGLKGHFFGWKGLIE